MHEVLIALQDNLASRIALRYAEQLETTVRFNMQAVHIPELNGSGSAPGSGWVKKKWENAVVQESREDIAQLIRNEYFFRFSNTGLKVLKGPRDQAILGELEERPYEFFIEGRLHEFEPDGFLAKLETRLYRETACPVLLVKNVVNPSHGTLILCADEPPRVSGWLARMLSGLPGRLDMAFCQGLSGGSTSGEPQPETVSPDRDTVLGTFETIDHLYTATSGELTRLARDYAMVVSVLPETSHPMAQMLAAVPSAVMLCPAGPAQSEGTK